MGETINAGDILSKLGIILPNFKPTKRRKAQNYLPIGDICIQLNFKKNLKKKRKKIISEVIQKINKTNKINELATIEESILDLSAPKRRASFASVMPSMMQSMIPSVSRNFYKDKSDQSIKLAGTEESRSRQFIRRHLYSINSNGSLLLPQLGDDNQRELSQIFGNSASHKIFGHSFDFTMRD